MATEIKIAAGSSATQIQAAIDAAPKGAIIRLAAGQYSFDRTVVIDRDDLSLIGAGAGKTVITLAKTLKGDPAFRVGQALFDEEMQNPLALADAKAGDNVIRIASSSHDLKVGDAIWIERENDDALFNAIGDTQWREDKPLRTAMAIVKSVSGDKITLDRDLPFDFTNRGTLVSEIDLARNVVLKGFTLKGAYGTPDPAKFSNTISAENGGMMLLINATDGVVLRDISLRDAGSNGLVLGKTIDAKISDISVSGAHNKGGGGNGYAFWIRDVYDSELTGLQAYDTRHAVLFASYTSAVGNSVQVDKTNRDINFHGGLDHGNIVIVDWSVRSVAEQSYLGGVTFVNPGTDYGAPTDPDANIIRFAKVIGTAREDIVFAVQTGADIATVAGPDWLAGGRGHDRLDAGSGNDTILASGGRDTVLGGQGTDLLLMDAVRADVRFVRQDGRIGIAWAEGVTWLDGIETLQLTDMRLGSADMAKAAGAVQVRQGQTGFEWISTQKDVLAGTQLNGLHLTGKGGVTAIANALDNRVRGSAGGDVVVLLDGRDWAQGGAGADILSGGGAADRLFGGAGHDVLSGGSGDDRLTGGKGPDRFIAGTGRDLVTDFSLAEGDDFQFRRYATEDVVQALVHWQEGGPTQGFAFRIIHIDGATALSITDPYDHSLVFLGLSAQKVVDFYL
ncbi:calcium-binding protein [Neogemmobacter tilapiae]|uniref:Calcium-binding protein n=1 Tax=Neogemmobacter tilapiae TaxID=875041 RepID=A0A918TS09_9RHOB|nr:calcium-binding protein [Gemmobacter tilapiae]GHC56616.1 hypothetical protein GCM10007315_19980 [Gemmobacter tilapiae]